MDELKAANRLQTDIFISVKKFIVENQCEDELRINLESRIERGLGITGDDAVEMLVAFGKKFNVDVSRFMAADYFSGEGINTFGKFRSRDKKILTVAHLVKAVIAGRLDESVINSAIGPDAVS